jgi:signal transduction histidine kinase
MASLGEIIRVHHAQILRLWTDEANRTAAARGLERPAFQNLMPTFLASLAQAGPDLGRLASQRRQQVEGHLSSRLRQGFQLAEIVEEFALLGRCIAAMWSPGRGVEPPERQETESLFEELHLASVAVAEFFTRQMMDDEQTEKQVLRLIQDVARGALEKDAPALQDRLKDVLRLVMEGMGAQSAALVLCHPVTEEVEVTVSVGAAEEDLERHLSTLDAASFAGRIATSEETTSLWDAEVTELSVSDSLRRSGIHSLLGVRLPPRHRLRGVMYVGVTEKRTFAAREIHRLQSLGEHLTVHLDNARLYGDLRATIDQLNSERDLRETFVSVLAHDLRGPLAAAKMSSHILMRHPERLEERRDLAVRIDRNIDRTDRMIRDLLDANRIRAGQPLPLRLDECDLGAVAGEVYEELVATYGERFVLKAADHVLGFWSGEELKRALWNLATNAVKYGASDLPITITVERTPDGARLSVHNRGAVIPANDQAHLFRPYARTHSAQVGGQRGWGLGLTLVQGCAQAHGGRVRVDSTEQAGTTFTVELPPDARPFQPRPATP